MFILVTCIHVADYTDHTPRGDHLMPRGSRSTCRARQQVSRWDAALLRAVCEKVRRALIFLAASAVHTLNINFLHCRTGTYFCSDKSVTAVVIKVGRQQQSLPSAVPLVAESRYTCHRVYMAYSCCIPDQKRPGFAASVPSSPWSPQTLAALALACLLRCKGACPACLPLAAWHSRSHTAAIHMSGAGHVLCKAWQIARPCTIFLGLHLL